MQTLCQESLADLVGEERLRQYIFGWKSCFNDRRTETPVAEVSGGMLTEVNACVTDGASKPPRALSHKTLRRPAAMRRC
jgi:hypothetical protein